MQYEGFVNVLFQEIKRNKPLIKWIASRLIWQIYFIYLEKKNFFYFIVWKLKIKVFIFATES